MYSEGTYVLALDQGTTTGWAYGRTGDRMGAYSFGSMAFRPAGPKTPHDKWATLGRFRRWLEDQLRRTRADIIVYERPFFRGPGSMYLYGFANLIECAGYEAGVRVFDKTPDQIKKRAGIKRAQRKDKGAMVKAARLIWPGVQNDHEADALWLLDLALAELASPTPVPVARKQRRMAV